MAISKVIGLKASICFMVFVYFKKAGMTLVSIPFLYASIVDFLVAIASHPSINLPLLLGKSSDGYFPLWSKLLFGPYLASVRLYASLKRLKTREPAYNEIIEGLYVGGWPSSLDRLPPGEPAIIDCTCELPRNPAFSKNAYMCLPTWDTRAPQPFQIESAVRWACRKRSQKKPIYIHCAFGHGRSVSVMCALLVALGVAEDWKTAEKIIRERRPCIRMNALHRKSLEEWSKCLLSSKGSVESSVSSEVLSGGASRKQ
ncbi:Dual specificity phosphatase [Cinnamomum micranthum f. kanehirae]|uniref:Dual specificity phosphatase n=1 Tax=Cinnamomum micranthum f. kanehirae TaxID=337451 RepID=A0A443NYH1_9MAGN|nr:Dual specificity phosphatase [Cinnamomum micranthum f. kanehirae]